MRYTHYVTMPLSVRFDVSSGLPPRRYLDSLVNRVREVGLTMRIGDAMSTLRRLDSDPSADRAEARAASTRLMELQQQLARLRAEVTE